MKVLKNIILLVPLAILGLCLSSCSEDDDKGGGGGQGKGLKLTEAIFPGGYRYVLSYDSEGRISRYDCYDSGRIEKTASFIYGDGIITVHVTGNDGYGSSVLYALDGNGFIERMIDVGGGDAVSFMYDSGQRLASAHFNDWGTEYFTWEDGNLVRVEAVDDDGRTETWMYEYNDEPSWKGVVYWDDALIDISINGTDFSLLANMGYLGKLPENLVSGHKRESSTATDGISYRFGKNGYVSEILDGSSMMGVTLVWK